MRSRTYVNQHRLVAEGVPSAGAHTRALESAARIHGRDSPSTRKLNLPVMPFSLRWESRPWYTTCVCSIHLLARPLCYMHITRTRDELNANVKASQAGHIVTRSHEITCSAHPVSPCLLPSPLPRTRRVPIVGQLVRYSVGDCSAGGLCHRHSKRPPSDPAPWVLIRSSHCPGCSDRDCARHPSAGWTVAYKTSRGRLQFSD